MSPSAPSQNGIDAVLAEVVEEFTDRVQAGEAVDVESYVQRYPEHAERLRQLLPALALLDDLGRSLSPDPGGAGAQRQRVQERLADLKMVDRLGQIRLEKAVSTGYGFDFRPAVQAYKEAFRDYGIDVTALAVEDTVRQIQTRNIRMELAAALDDWADVCRDSGKWTKMQMGSSSAMAWVNGPALNSKELLGLARAVDPDELRNRLRDALERGDAKALKEVATSGRVDRLPLSTLILLGQALARTGAVESAVAVLKEGQRQCPSNFWINYELADVLAKLGPAHMEEALRYFTAAVALRPRIAVAHVKLGLTLYHKGRLDDAIAEYHEALRLANDFPMALEALWTAFADQGRLDEAIREYNESPPLKEHRPEAYCNFGDFLLQQGRFKEAAKAFRRGLELGGRNLAESYNLYTLRHTFRIILEYGQLCPKSYPPAQELLWKAEQLAELDEHLSAVLEGKAQPRDTAERLALAHLCLMPWKKRYAAAVRFYSEVFAHKPQLADDRLNSSLWYWDTQHRYNAACAAALAGCGQGADADKLDTKERARLRQQALDWLRADLKSYRQAMEKARQARENIGKAGPWIVQQMQHWLQDPDFAGVRGEKALTKLPEEERPVWRKLWADVAEMLAKAQGKEPPEKKSDTK